MLDVRRVRLAPPSRSALSKAALPLSAPRTSFNAAITRRRQVAFTAIGLDDVKRLKNATGTTVNDVVLAVCTGALRALPLEGDELPDKPLVAVVPVSVRSGRSTRPRAPTRCRRCSCSCRPPPRPDRPADAIHDGTKGAKEEHNALGADMLLNWAEHATPNVFASAARLYSAMRLADRHRPIANLVISNVPGPDFPLYLGGAEMEAGFPLGPVMDGMGVNITVMSYRGILNWGIIACPESIPKAVEPDRRRAAGPRRAARRGRAGAGPLPLRGGGRRRPGLGLDPTGRLTTRAAREGGRGATVIDEAPEHTGMAGPKVWVAGS